MNNDEDTNPIGNEENGKKKGKVFYVTSYNYKQLAIFYKQTAYVIEQWHKLYIEKIGEKLGRFFTPKQILAYITEVGLPPGYTSICM